MLQLAYIVFVWSMAQHRWHGMNGCRSHVCANWGVLHAVADGNLLWCILNDAHINN